MWLRVIYFFDADDHAVYRADDAKRYRRHRPERVTEQQVQKYKCQRGHKCVPEIMTSNQPDNGDCSDGEKWQAFLGNKRIASTVQL